MSEYKPLDIEDKMPFGKHKGVMLGTMIEDNSGYAQWLLDNTTVKFTQRALDYLKQVKAEEGSGDR